MTIPVINYPTGLSAIVNSKTSGAQPGFLAESLVGTVDVGTLLLLNNRETVQLGSCTAPVVGTNFYNTGILGNVPPGELWYVWAYGISTLPGAGEAITYQPAVQIDSGSVNIPCGDTVAVSAGQRGYAWARNPFFLAPGSRFSFNIVTLTLTPVASGVAAITRLRV